jgi:hypothetical protein
MRTALAKATPEDRLRPLNMDNFSTLDLRSRGLRDVSEESRLYVQLFSELGRSGFKTVSLAHNDFFSPGSFFARGDADAFFGCLEALLEGPVEHLNVQANHIGADVAILRQEAFDLPEMSDEEFELFNDMFRKTPSPSAASAFPCSPQPRPAPIHSLKQEETDQTLPQNAADLFLFNVGRYFGQANALQSVDLGLNDLTAEDLSWIQRGFKDEARQNHKTTSLKLLNECKFFEKSPRR